jgi:hypothetical protein
MLLHLLLPFVYALLFVFSFPNYYYFAQFVVGVVIGFSLFFFDRLAHVFFIQPETEFSQLVKESWRKKDIIGIIKLLSVAKTLQEHLTTRSVLFLCIYIILTIFVITSTGSTLGVGLVLGLGPHFCFDLFMYRRDLVQFHKHFLWQLKKELAEKEVDTLIAAFVLFFVVVSLLVLF